MSQLSFHAKADATFFAPAARSSPETIERQREALSRDPAIGALLDSYPEPAAIINADRQIVRANSQLAALAGRPEPALVGLRMGEAIGCEHGWGYPNRCGTTPACAMCGAANAMATTLGRGRGEPAVEDCRVTLRADLDRQPLDFRVWTRPFRYEGDSLAVFALRDTSDEQRRRVLERMFFHDVLNAAGGLRDVLRLWPELNQEQTAELSARVAPLAAQVVEEIEAQRDLAAAERGELTATSEQVDVRGLLDQIVTLYSHHTVAEGKTLEVAECSGPAWLHTDPVLLRRVLGNLVKNALEASTRRQRVTVRYTDGVRFSVHNEALMPEAVRLQVFQRSFSTKGGKGRGIGTYSARLMAERYLGGRLSFSSVAGQGTTFVLELPAASSTP